jgi:hypothetical protein
MKIFFLILLLLRVGLPIGNKVRSDAVSSVPIIFEPTLFPIGNPKELPPADFRHILLQRLRMKIAQLEASRNGLRAFNYHEKKWRMREEKRRRTRSEMLMKFRTTAAADEEAKVAAAGGRLYYAALMLQKEIMSYFSFFFSRYFFLSFFLKII